MTSDAKMMAVRPVAAMVAMAFVFTINSCAPSPEPVTADPEHRERDLSHGYALLHGVLEQNRQVDQAVRIPFRSVGEETLALLRDIASASGDAADQLHEHAEAAPELGLDEQGLPMIEQAARESIEAASRSDLLAGDRQLFETYLLLSQAEATRYVSHLALNLAEIETDAARQRVMQDVAERFDELYNRVVQRIQRGVEATAADGG